MKRVLQGLGISLACSAVVLGGLAHLFPLEQVGCLGPSSRAVCVGSGVYIGHGLILTNQHVAALLSENSSFRVPAWRYLLHTIDAGVGQVVFLSRDMELGIVKLKPSLLDVVGIVKPCLSSYPVKEGETLMATSSVYGKFPPVSAALVVSDARPLMRLDPFPGNKNPYSAVTIIANLSADQAALVGPGSSGGPVLNEDGELVGLVWTGRELSDGSEEVWITPASAWFSQMEEYDLEAIRGTRCT